MVSSNFSGKPFRLEENVWLRWQDIGGNFSNYGGELWIRKNSYSPTWSNGYSDFSFHLNGGQVAGWSFTYDFRNSDALRLCYVESNIGHNGDGTKWFPIDGYANVNNMGYAEVHSGIQAPTIPRTSNGSFPYGNWVEAGGTIVFWTNRASGGFTHDVDWYFGNASGRALTNIGDGGNWTVPMSLLDQIPNSTSGVGHVRNHTYSNGSMIGWSETAVGITAGPGVVPTWSGTPTVVEATAGLSAIIGSGRYLQGISKLKGTIVGAAGVYSSSIVSQTHTAGGETANGAVGNFVNPISVAGTAVPVVHTITDSRGRQKTHTNTINVLPYSRPLVSKFTIDRVNASNQLDPVGTRMKISVTGVVQSIINSTERNRLTLRVYSKLRSSSTWSAPTNIVVDSSTLSYNSAYYLAGPFSVASAYDIKVELSDKFNTTVAGTQAGTGEVFQHWSQGLAVGKYWERGTVDAIGQMYQNDGRLVLDKRSLFIKPTNTSPNWTYDPLTGRMNLTVGSKKWDFDGVFTAEYRAYKILFNWGLDELNGAGFCLRGNGVDFRGEAYYSQSIYITGTGTPAGQQAVQTQGPYPAFAAAAHWGEITVTEPMYIAGTANQKRMRWEWGTFSPASITQGIAGISGQDQTAFDGFSLYLSSQNISGLHAGAHAWISVTPII